MLGKIETWGTGLRKIYNSTERHDKPLDREFDRKNYICVSCDVIDYTPVSIEKIKSLVK